MPEISSKHYFPKYSLFVFMLLYGALAWVYGYQNTLFELPQSIHQWRQADCLSLATNYYEDQNPFLEPSVHYLGRDGTGKTISEFPIIYYAVAKIWTITGRNIWVYRSLIALLFFLGLTALFKLIEREVENSYAGLFVGLLMFTSPVMVYYSNNFLMNIPALSLAMMGIYFFYTFKHTKQTKHFIWCCFFYTLAALLKVSSLLSFIAIIMVILMDNFLIKFSDQKTFRLNYKSIIAILMVLIIPFLWYKYAVYYNNQHTGGIFLIGILPIWKMTMVEIKETWRYILIHMRFDYFRPFIEVTFAIVAVFTVVLHRHVQKLTFILLILIGLGVVCFCLLFFKALQWHDYYTIDLYMLIPILIMSFFTAFKKNTSSYSIL
ncbi:MAG: glycosyltransferase family 39 protein [Saprospiraceae bacterium]|nr:glycosyltransferase family 39 protein [Saprospiraceae bacterium]